MLEAIPILLQHEISLDAYNRLTSTPDAKGRTIEVIKVPVPYPLFRTFKEADGVHVSAAHSACCPVDVISHHVVYACLQQAITPCAVASIMDVLMLC